MSRNFDRKIILEDGTEFYGYGFGAKGDALVELVFNTSMVGYQVKPGTRPRKRWWKKHAASWRSHLH